MALRPWSEVWRDIVALRPAVLDGCDLEPNEEGWVTILCPAHKDETPSLRVNVQTGSVKCMSHQCFGVDAPNGSNLNNLEDYILDTATRRSRVKRPDDVLGDLAERRMLPRDWLIERFGLEPSQGGYCIPVDDPETDPDIEIDYELDGITRRQRHYLIKRGEWLDKHKTSRPKYRWEPKLSKSGVKSTSLIYNLHRIALPDDKVVYIVAGPPDCWAMTRAGLASVSFLAGEDNAPKPRALQKLIDVGVEEAVIIYDRDQAGEDGAAKVAVALAQSGIKSTVLTLPEDMPEGSDITDLWRACEGDAEDFITALSSLEAKEWPALDVPMRQLEGMRRVSREQARLPDICWMEPFQTYREALAKSTEACDEYHFYALMNVIGALFGRRAFVFYGKKLFPNQYTCLVGDTGVARKSTANRYAVDVVERLYDRDARMIQGTRLTIEEATGSAEGLLEAVCFADVEPDEYDAVKAMLGWKQGDDGGDLLTEEDLYRKHERRILIHQDEFTKMLVKAKSGGGGAIIPHLLTMFDAPKEIRLRTRKKPLILVNPVVSILSDSTPEYLGAHFDELEWTSGFGNRMLFVDGARKPRIARPLPPDEVLFSRVLKHIADAFRAVAGSNLNKYNVEFSFSRDADRAWTEQYERWIEGRDTEGFKDQVAATERVPDYALKFALIYALMTPDHEQTIIGDDIERGWAAASYAERTTQELVISLVQEKMARWQNRLADYIEGHAPVEKRRLQQNFKHIPAPTLMLLLDNLEKLNVVKYIDRGYIPS